MLSLHISPFDLQSAECFHYLSIIIIYNIDAVSFSLLSHRGAALLVEAADMGDPDAQYELGCRLRVEVRLHMICTATSVCHLIFL